jgi:hypothetical protein
MPMKRLAAIALLLAALPLAGCETMHGSVAGSECKVMTRPPYVVEGKAAYDQNWIDNEIEGGVGACGWTRPAPRPPELDAQPARRAIAPKARRGLAARARDAIKQKAATIWPAPSSVPQAPLPVPDEAVPAPAPADPPAAPRSAIDQLLNPRQPLAPVRQVYP